jgi:nucleoside-diphosphate-sugar epimerase
MKVLVTGSNGFLGTALIGRLLTHGETDIRCFVRAGSNTNKLECIKAKHPSKVELFVGDLAAKEDADRALAGVDVVYHLAAALRGAPADMFRNTVVHSQRLIEAIERTGRKIRIVLVSSIAVYGVSHMPKGSTVNEETPIDPFPEKRDVYTHTKVWQEKVFWEARDRQGFPMIVVRPAVIYGAPGFPMPSRVGIALFGIFVNLGGKNILPLTYVENCADAIVFVSRKARDGEVYNIHDNNLPKCNDYLRRSRGHGKKLRTIRCPYSVLYFLSTLLERYVAWSEGQLPPIFTPYKVSAVWKMVRYDNSKLRNLGWRQPIPTEVGLSRTFDERKELTIQDQSP